MMKALGLPISFNSTKGKFVDDKKSHLSGAKIKQKRKYKVKKKI
jgi:hypothetical protein